MFLHGSASRRIRGDYRPSVHDSEGLAILNGQGERIWRPLTNPRTLQSSAFVDKDPKGFGLAQRNRAFTQFEDLEARYEKRPTLWIEPKGGWGDGSVELLEIPADEEIHDNIVAFWRPARPVEAQKPYAYGYRMSWGDSIPIAWSGARVRQTWVGNARKGAILFVLDFDGPALKDIKDLPVAEVRASAGTVQNVVVQRNPETGGVRSSFEVQAQGAEMIELRLVLKAADQMVSESWVYRWTRA
jgi:glucans biosynthesis protein